MMGHTQDRVTQSYFKLDINTLRESYKNAITSLTFIEKVEVLEITDERVLALEAENKKIRE
ncbi:MAG: hypothetical protein ACXVHT_07970 [Methanobacterium sp.]